MIVVGSSRCKNPSRSEAASLDIIWVMSYNLGEVSKIPKLSPLVSLQPNNKDQTNTTSNDDEYP